MADSLPNGGVSKVVAGVLGLLAVVAGIAAIVTPMNERIDAVERGLEKHTETESHIGTAEALAAMRVQFVEIETQFRNLNERTQRMEVAFKERVAALDEKLQLEFTPTVAALDLARAEREKLRDGLNALALDVERMKATGGK